MKDYQTFERSLRDQQADEYEDWFVENRGVLFDVLERRVFANAVAHLQPKHVLDAGSGTGRIAESIGELAYTVPCDLSFESLRYAIKRGRCSRAVCANLTAIPAKSERFDAITCCQVLGQLQYSELIAALEEMRRVLRVGGTLLFSVYNLDFWMSRRGVFEEGDEGGFYFKRFTRGYVKYLAERAGFRLDGIEYYRTLRHRRLKKEAWLTLDRGISSTPLLNRFASTYMLVRLNKN